MISVRTNVQALGAQRNMSATNNALGKSMEKLSSGFRINRAGDDAAGLAISEKMKGQISGLNQAARNSLDGISMIQTAEAGLDVVQGIMQRMRELGVQGSNDTLGSNERTAINGELQQLRTEIQNISNRTKFNGRGLLSGDMAGVVGTGSEIKVGAVLSSTNSATITNLDASGAKAGRTYSFTTGSSSLTLSDGTTSATVQLSNITANTSSTLDFGAVGVKMTITAAGVTKTAAELASDFGNASANELSTSTATSGSATLQTGANKGEETTVSFIDTRIEDSAGSEISALKAALVAFGSSSTQANASDLISKVDTALGYISSQRATFGAVQNRLEQTISNVKAASENLSASNSRIRDVDVAAESSEMARSNILMQAGVSILSQANQSSQLALKLLG